MQLVFVGIVILLKDFAYKRAVSVDSSKKFWDKFCIYFSTKECMLASLIYVYLTIKARNIA